MIHKLVTPINSMKSIIYSIMYNREKNCPEIEGELNAIKESLFTLEQLA